MLKKYIDIVLISFLIPLGISSQEIYQSKIDSISVEFSESLLKNKLSEEVLIYTSGCHGCEPVEKCCCYEGPMTIYVIWKEVKKSWIKKFKCCSISMKKEIYFDNLWGKFDEKKDEIFSSELRTEYEMSHYSFYNLQLMTKHKRLKINLFDYLFDEDNKYAKQNSKEPVREFQIYLTKRIALKEKEKIKQKN